MLIFANTGKVNDGKLNIDATIEETPGLFEFLIIFSTLLAQSLDWSPNTRPIYLGSCCYRVISRHTTDFMS